MGNTQSRWSFGNPVALGTFTLSGASAQSGEYANMTCTVVNPEAINAFDREVIDALASARTEGANGSAPSAAATGYRIEVLGKCGSGALATTYDSLLFPPGSDGAPVRCTFKVSRISLFPDVSKDPHEDYYQTNGFNIVTARKAVLNEAAIYRYLGDQGQQGSLVPRYWGIGALDPPGASVKRARTMCSVMEDVGKPLPREERDDLATRARIHTLYRKLHAADVLHLDVEWRHILRSEDDGRLRLIDFDQADLRSSHPDHVWVSTTATERRRVETRWSSEKTRNGTWGELWEEEMNETPVPFRTYPPRPNVKAVGFVPSERWV